jgi:hypothetical protein
MANDASASSAPVAALRALLPRTDGAIPNPIGRKRVLASRPVTAATPTFPPPPITHNAVNWAGPDQTSADITSVGNGPKTWAASSPKVSPMAAAGNNKEGAT